MTTLLARRVLVLGGAACALLGAVVLFGWLVGNHRIVQVVPGFVPMQFNTALAFLILSVALLASAVRPGLSLVAAGLVLAIGVLTLAEYVFDLDLGIDEFFMVHDLTTRSSHPGRMAPNTALCFALAGLSCLLRRWLPGWALFCGVMVIALGASAFFGYVSEVETAYGWGRLTQMAVHTSLGFAIAGAGLSAAGWMAEVGRGGNPLRWSAVIVVGVVGTCSVCLWQAVDAKQAKQIRTLIRSVAEETRSDIANGVQAQILALERMGLRWRSRGTMPRPEWEVDARRFVSDTGLIQAVAWIDREYRVRWVAPLAGNESSVGRDLGVEARRRAALEAARTADRTTMTRTVDLVQGGKGFFVYVPLVVEGRFDGIIGGVYRVGRLLDGLLEGSRGRSYSVAVFDGDEQVYESAIAGVDSWAAPDVAVAFPHGVAWRLRVRPSAAVLQSLSSPLPKVVLGAALLLSLLLGVAVHAFQRERRHARLLAAAHRALQRSETHIRTVLDTVVDGVITIDEQGIIHDVNPAAERIFGHGRDEMIGRNLDMLMPEPHLGEHGNRLANYLRTGDVKVGASRESVGRRKDGAQFPVDFAINEMVSDGQRQFVGLVRDITARKRSEQALERHAAELARSNRDLDQFAYVASHDLKAPLRAIDNLTCWIDEDAREHLPEESLRHLDQLRQRVHRLEGLLDDLLQYSRAGRTTGDVAEVDAGQLLREIVEMHDLPPGFRVEVDGDLPVLQAHPAALKLVLMNLLGNAVKHRGKDDAQVRISARDAGEYYEFRVADNGPGIASEFHDRIFQMFQTLRPRDRVDGSGIGLSVSKRTVEAQGGKIWVESVVGEGATFCFLWPKMPAVATEV